MKLLNKLLSMVVVLTMLLSCVPAAVSTAAAAGNEYKPGLDIIILIDISNSNFSELDDYKDSCYDRNVMCLDAAAMLINMCDAEYSRVAVVPFNDEVPDSQWFDCWVDVSIPANRQALCNELYCDHMLSYDDYKWHVGDSKHSVALEHAYSLMTEKKQTNNPVLIVVLGDSVLGKGDSIDACVEFAEGIKNENATIYCVDMGSYDEDTLNEQLLFRVASGEGDKADYYWYDVEAEELKQRFSEIFADMIGSTHIPAAAYIEDENICYEFYIPNESVTEANLVLNRSHLSSSDYQILLNGAPIGDEHEVITYTFTEPAPRTSAEFSIQARTYDFISIKLVNPTPGKWKIIAPKSEEVTASTTLSYDILFNYQIEPVVDKLEEVYYQSHTINFSCSFVTEDGTKSTDKELYRGTAVENPGIEAMLYLYDENGASIGNGYTMTPNQETLNFNYALPVTALGALPAGTSTFYYEVNMRGDYMNKTSARESFTVENTCPGLTGASEIKWEENLQIANIFETGDKANGMIVIDAATLNSYFSDKDGDVLTCSVTEAYGVNASMNDGALVIEKADNEMHDDAYVVVTASDKAGQSVSMKIMVNVLSVKSLVEECVSVNIVPSVAGAELVKGEEVTLNVEFSINAPEGADKNAFPYSYLNSTVNTEKLFANASVVYTFEANDDISGADNGDGTATINVGKVDNATITANVEVNIGPEGNVITKKATSETFVVKNAEPVIVDISDELSAAGASVVTDAQGNNSVSFDVDKDKPVAEKLSFDIGAWFSDADVDNGFDEFHYYVTIETLEETSDIFSPARSLLRMVGLADKEGPIVQVNGVEAMIAAEEIAGVKTYDLGASTELNIDAMRFGNAKVTVIAVDNDDITAEQSFEYHITSSVETLMCIVVYVILLIILIIIIAVLINKFIIHQKWKKKPGYCVTLNGYQQMTLNGSNESPFLITGRKTTTLKNLARQFNIDDGGAGQAAFAAIKLWPTLGNKIKVELNKKSRVINSVVIKVNNNTLSKSAKWGSGEAILVAYKDSNGVEYECEFRRS